MRSVVARAKGQGRIRLQRSSKREYIWSDGTILHLGASVKTPRTVCQEKRISLYVN